MSTKSVTIPKIDSYLGQKGYTIMKKDLSAEQLNFIKTELTVKPYVPGAPNNSTQNTFPVYRESGNKIYVPRYFGEKHFGPPTSVKIPDGEDISPEFVGILRDNQKPAVEKYLNYVTSSKSAAGLLELPCGFGKTSLSLYIASVLKKKTLVIVHKEFLMNQWVERIQQFIPNARIGKIQGQTIDIENKDIVFGMLQSLSMKDYPASLFDSFGLTIVDEVHHISSEVFSNVLFKLVTKYMLGLSATMNRKDGTTNVFKMFLGEVVYKVEKKNDNIVEVRAITYKVNDDEFNETILDYRGKPQNSSMISKLCEYNRRTEFIIQTLCDFISVDNVDKSIINEYKLDMDKNIPTCQICNKNINYLIRNTCCDSVKYCMICMENIEIAAENNITYSISPDGKKKASKERAKCPNCKKGLKYEQNYIENKYVKPLEQTHTIVMAHNLSILHYMYKKIVCKNLASVGYYIGGMKESELKRSETKQVVLASYSQSSEGLDIPTLNAEFLITPKTDIVQVVGRILRAKHAFSHPIIYDFVDSHDVFKRQWLKRKSFYKNNNYKIVGINSMEYNVNFSKWKVICEQKLENNKLCIEKKCSSDKSISNNSDSEEDENASEMSKDNYLIGKCLLKIKK